MKKILLVKTSSMGDVVHNLATVSDIKRWLPDSVIDWVVEDSFVDIPSLHPGVQKVVPVRLRSWRKSRFGADTRSEIEAVKKILARSRYDVVIDTQGLIKSALVSRWAGVPVSGYRWGSARESLATLFYSRRYAISRDQHAVDRNRQLVAAALDYSLDGLPLDYGIDTGGKRNAIEDLKSNYIVCLHGTSRISKLWPESHWQKLLPALIANGLQPVLVSGNATERSRSERLAQASPSIVLAPQLSLRALAGLLTGSRGVIGVDTGPVHLAAAAGCRTVALYTDTDPSRTGVVSADPDKVINIGNIGTVPPVEQVLSALAGLGIG